MLAPTLAVSAMRACMRSATMYAVAGEDTRQSKSEKAGLTLRVGRMHQWMCLVKVGKFVHSLAAVYLTAALETVLEELISQCAEVSAAGGTKSSSKSPSAITAVLLEQVIASRGDLWGLFQPYAHLSSSRIASGTLVLSPILEGLLDNNTNAKKSGSNATTSKERSVRQILLTTCVGSTEELEEMVLIASGVCQRAWNMGASFNSNVVSKSSSPSILSSTSSSSSSLQRGSTWSPPALQWSCAALPALYHFMRCSQLEYVGQADGRTPIQELVYERPYLVLPPVVEWVRCLHAFAEHRGASVIDTDDVAQTARYEKC